MSRESKKALICIERSTELYEYKKSYNFYNNIYILISKMSVQ